MRLWTKYLWIIHVVTVIVASPLCVVLLQQAFLGVVASIVCAIVSLTAGLLLTLASFVPGRPALENPLAQTAFWVVGFGLSGLTAAWVEAAAAPLLDVDPSSSFDWNFYLDALPMLGLYLLVTALLFAVRQRRGRDAAARAGGGVTSAG